MQNESKVVKKDQIKHYDSVVVFMMLKCGLNLGIIIYFSIEVAHAKM